MNIDDMPAGREIDTLVAEKVMHLPLERLPMEYTNPCAKNYSTDLAVAWEIFWAESIYSVVPNFLSRDSRGWLVIFGDCSATVANTDAGAGALAICRAALKLVMGTPDASNEVADSGSDLRLDL